MCLFIVTFSKAKIKVEIYVAGKKCSENIAPWDLLFSSVS